MSSSRHTRRQRQQQSLRRHRMKLERLEKRYALDAAAITDPADWGWAGVVENAKVFSVAQDSTGAVYTAGTFSGTIDLDFSASSSELISVGADDIFVAKYDSGGTFVWAKQFGSTGRDKAYTITIDQSDNLRIGGFFEGSVDFDPGVGTDTLTSAGAGDGYVLSLDADGNYLWAGRFGGVGTGWANGDGDFVNTIAVDGSGNTYVGGVIYQGSGPAVDVEFGTGSTTVTGSGQQNTIIVKIDASGELVWAKHFDSGFLNGPNSLDINTNGDIVIGGGLHSQSMDADPGLGVATLNASGLSDAYIVVLDQDGNFRWAHEYGTAGEESIKGVATDASGNIYVNAGISGSVDLDPGAGEELFTAVGSYDLVIVSFDSDGNYRWSESYGDASAQSGWGMTVNGQDELVVSGLFEGSLTLPAGSSVSASASIGGNDHFVLWLNTDNGQALKVTSLGTTSNDAEKIAVWDFGPNGLLVSGWLAGGGDVDFSPDSSGSIIAVPSGGTSYVRRMSAKSPWGYPLKDQPQGNWLHSSGEGPSQSSTWYPTAIPSHESLTQHGYATYWHHTGTPAGWFTQPTFSTNKFFVFETYVTSETTQSIDYLLGGNEGHSLFVNNQFVKGAGFGNDNVSGTLLFQAGVPVKVTLVGYNSGADTHISFRTADLQNIEDIPGVSVSAKLLRVTSAEHGFELDNTKPTITGFGAPGASVEVFADLNRDGTTETSIGTTTVASDNSWSLTSDAWLPGGPVNVSATQDTGDPELSTADGVITVRTNRPGGLVEVGADLLADGYINAAEAASNIVLRTPFDGSMISSGNSLWVFTDTGGNRTFALQTVGSTAPGNNYKDVGFSADLLREGPQAIDAWFTPTSSGGKAREVLSVIKDTIAPEAPLGISDASIFSNETATVSITLSEDVNGLDVTDFVVTGGTLTSLSGASPNLTATFTPDVDFSGTATISIASDAFTDVAGNPNSESSEVTLNVTVPFSVTSSEHAFELDNTKPTITGFGTPGASIEVFADLNRDGTTETSIGTTTVASDNSWSLTSDAWLPGGPVNVSATQDTGDPELSTADGVITVRTNRPGGLVEVGADLLADGYINAAEAASNIVLRTPFDGSMISSGNSLWVFTDTGGNRTFALQTVGSTAPGNNYKDVGFSADLLREGPQAIDAWFTPTSSGGKAREVLSVIKDTIAPEAPLGISDASIFSNETATVSITLSEDVNGLDVTDFVVTGGTLTSLSGASPNLTATFTPDVDFSGTATISIASDAFTDVAGNPNTASHSVITTVLPEILTTGELSRFEDEGIGGEFGIWTDAIAFAENRIASYVPTGSGFVRTWSLSESNEITRSGDISSPHTVHNDGFGFSLVLDETILGIGSPKTWINAPHDGRFYVYDAATRASIATLNPQPHTAQYFGASSDISENDYFVVSETGNWDHDTSFGITFYGYDNAGQPT
ncbi:Ig-like domain-containing protein, partial [bacterium]|nr:Ig-like domain-containing protein [bacterium]